MKTIKIVALSSIVLIAAGAATPAIAKTDIDNPNLTPISQDNSVPKITNGYIATVKIDGVSHSKIVKTYAEASNYIQMMSDQNPSSYISSTIGDASPGEIYAAEQAEGKAAAAEQTAAIVKEQAAEKVAAKQAAEKAEGKQAEDKEAAAEQTATQSSNGYIATVKIDGVSHSKIVKTYAEASNYIKMMSDQNPSSYISSTIGDASPGEIYAAEQTAAIVKEQAAEKVAAKQAAEKAAAKQAEDKAEGKAAAAEQAAAQSSKSSISSKNSHPEAETQKSVATNTGSTNVKATKSKVNPVASSGTLSVHTEVPKTSGAVRMTAAGAKTPAAAKNKTLSTLLPTTGDNALLSIILTFCGMVVLAGTGILLGLKQKYSGRHTK